MNKAQYLDLFIEESQENMEYLAQNLLTLKDNPEDRGLLKICSARLTPSREQQP